MSIQGDIQTFTLSAIGRMIHEEKKTGILRVSSGDYVTRIYFKNGGIVFISGDLTEDLSLGALLKADNLVQEKEIQHALEISNRTKKRLGVVLAEQGYVTKENLVKVLTLQFKEAISKALTWKEGSFHYQDGLEGYVEDIRLEMDPIRLVAEAERWKEYRILIPNDQVVFQIKETDARPNNISGEGIYDVMLLIDGNRNVTEIIQATGKTRIAVYRAITSLFVQGVIERKTRPEKSQLSKQISSDTIILFFLPLISEILADISTDLGTRKADSILDSCIKASPYYNIFLNEIHPGDSSSEMIQKVRQRVSLPSNPVKSTDVASGLKNTVVHFLNEEHRLLGLKAVNNTLKRIIALTETMTADQKLIAGSFIPHLIKRYSGDGPSNQTEDIFARTTSGGIYSGGAGGVPNPNLSGMGGAVIITFYSRIAQILIKDLEDNIGVKSIALLDKTLRNSEYYEQFLCRFDARNDIPTNVENIRRHISNEGHRLSKMSFIKGFQQVLIELLTQERQILGDKPTRASLLKVHRFISDPKQKEFLPLAKYFFATLESEIPTAV